MIQPVRFASIIAACIVMTSPAIAGAVTFNCNTTGNQNSNLWFSIPDEPTVLEGVIKLRRAEEDTEFPAYGLMKISAGPTSLKITMHRSEDTEKAKVRILIDDSGTVSELESPYLTDHSRELDYAILLKEDAPMAIHLGENVVLAENPFSSTVDVTLGCAGSGTFQMIARHRVVTEEYAAGYLRAPYAPLEGRWKITFGSHFEPRE